MSRSAENSWRAKAGTLAMLLPFLALTACANSNDAAMAEKLAAAEAAANKAIEAQHAAEKAAATAARLGPTSAPAPTPEPRIVSDLPENEDHDNGDDMSSNDDQASADTVNTDQG